MKLTPTNLGRVVIYLMGAAAVAVICVLMPELAREEAAAHPDIQHTNWPFFAVAYVMAIPYFIALYQANRLLGYIDHGQAFTTASVLALKRIKFCTFVFVVIFVIAATTTIGWTRYQDPTEDSAGFAMLSLIFSTVTATIATFAAVLQRLLGDAVAMKTDNDLTI